MKTGPSICILTSQYFDWGIYGGFGSMSRKLAESLARAGHRVSVIVPGRRGQRPEETIEGVEIRSFSPRNVFDACRLIRQSSADLFHSQDPTILTYLAERLHPRRTHLVTSRDPRDLKDWWIEFRYATPARRLLTPFNYLTEAGLFVRQAVRNADAVFCPAHFLKEKVKRLYGLKTLPDLLPNLIDVPATLPAKSDRPTLTFVARWDKRKRPWIFLDLAGMFPEYRFVAVGQGSASAEMDFDARLRRRYRDVPNLEMPGLINRFREPDRMHRLLSDTWVFVSTAVREGLPLTFLEAAAYGCPIVSSVDPDQFATKFGRQVHNDDYAGAIRALLAEGPLEKGRAAYAYVRDTYETSKALQAHVEVYESHVRGVGRAA
ncbi:glycosyltransferase family 4 protein [Nitrospira sp. Nam80]